MEVPPEGNQVLVASYLYQTHAPWQRLSKHPFVHSTNYFTPDDNN